jgi:excisionase family DNA binding protein
MSKLTSAKPLSVTVKTAREITGLGNTKIYDLIKQDKLKTISIGRRRLVLYDSLESLIKAA